MFSKLMQLFKRGKPIPGPGILKSNARRDDDADLGWLDPPSNPLDVVAWDQYWIEHVRHGLGPPLFDMFSDDRKLVEVMNAKGMKSILCAGNGISQEPRALAQAGFQVIALDISPHATEIARCFNFPPHGFDFFCEPEMRRPGGAVDFVVGDILVPAICPGPFDVIIERRTAQNYYSHDMGAVLAALAGRLEPNGILLSHCHDGGWRPPAEPRHLTRSWFISNQWTIWNGGPGQKPPGQVAWLFTTTG